MASGAVQCVRYFTSGGGASSVIIDGAIDRASFNRASYRVTLLP